MRTIDLTVMKRDIIAFVFSVITLALVGCDSSSNSGVEPCVLQIYGSVSNIQVLFKHVKKYDYCDEYTTQILKTDQYGNEHWVNYGRVVNFSKEEYEEMKLYKDVWAYDDIVLSEVRIGLREPICEVKKLN